jgi:creatinine amidohydrolase
MMDDLLSFANHVNSRELRVLRLQRINLECEGQQVLGVDDILRRMSEIFPFDHLTWPEVAELPRDLPLVLPLGQLQNPAGLASALGHPSEIGLLPAIPYGWPGSGLTVPLPYLAAYVCNLLECLRHDGFTNLTVLLPEGLTLGLPSHIEYSLPHPLDGGGPGRGLPASALDKVIILPIGHTEQHGHHLPLSTDTLIIDAIAQGTAQAAPESAFALPAMPYGVSMHRAEFAGTFDAGGRAFEDFWVAVIDSLVARGFTRFYLLSGHGGNMSFLVNVVKYAGDRHPRISGKRIFCATAFLHTSGPEGVAALEKYRRSAIGGMGHACELETSMILHLRPDLVHMERAVDEIKFISTPSYYMDWIEGGALIANPPWSDDTATGAYGAGSLATAEHGRTWLQTAIDEKVKHVGEIHEQYTRRLAAAKQRLA